MIKVAIVEDNDQFRKALEAIINQEKDTELLGSYTSAEKSPGCPGTGASRYSYYRYKLARNEGH